MIKRLATKEMQSAVFLLQIVADGCIVENQRVLHSATVHRTLQRSTQILLTLLLGCIKSSV